MLRILPLFVAAGVAVCACRDPVEGLPPFAPVLADREVWSGGELRVSEPSFTPDQPLPVVLLDGDTLPLRRVDDTTVAARLPITTGTFAVRVTAGKQVMPLGDVTLHGFLDVVGGPPMSGQPYWLVGGPPTVIAAGDSGAVIVDVRFGTISQFIPDSIHSSDCSMGVGPTYRRDRFVFQGNSPVSGCGGPKLWNVHPQPQLLDTLAFGGGPWYTTGQPADQRWVFNWNNNVNFLNCATQPCTVTYFQSADGPSGLTVSPRGDRFLWLPHTSWPVTVWDAVDLDSAFTIPALRAAYGYFSFEGDTLVLVAKDTASRVRVVAVDANNGTVLRDVALDSLPLPNMLGWVPWSVAFDPARPWLYAGVLSPGPPSWAGALVVIDRTTWTAVGVLPFAVLPYGATAIVPSPLEHRVYVVSAIHGYSVHQSPARIMRFTTP